MLACLEKPKSRYSDFFKFGDELYGRLVDESGMRFYLALTLKELSDFLNEFPYGEFVTEKFPSTRYDISEASACMALGRGTAAVFHSVRCLEAGILAISRCLNIPDPVKAAERNWGSALRKIKEEKDRRWPTSTDCLTGDGQFFDSLYAALAAMQNPYRNGTMHLDQKYTPDEARHIFEMIGGLMKKLSSRMDEEGNPRA